MEESVNFLGGVMEEVAATQREQLVRANVIARVRLRQPHGARVRGRLPRLRFVLPMLAAVGGLALWWATKDAPLSFAVGEVAGSGAVGDRLQAPADRGLPLHFSDGSLVALNEGARVQVTSLDSRGATLRIEQGRAEVSVHHRRHTRWQLRAGSFEVLVTGTRFSIDWDNRAEALTVVMSEGTVEVSGREIAGGAPIVVTAGQRFRATARESRWTLAAAASSSDPTQATYAVSPVVSPAGANKEAAASGPPTLAPPPAAAPSARASSAASTAVAPRTWQALARSGHYQEALAAVERTGFDRACKRLGAQDLVQLGDAARLARSPAKAEEAYRVARRRFPAIDRPAFALGLVAFDQRRDFRTAAKWFDTYVREYPNGPLAREAVGRGMESWHRAGDAGRARRAARDYLSQAPTGPYAPLARQLAAP